MPVVVAPNPAAVRQAQASISSALRFIDIGVNLTDPVFRGVHHGRKKHEDDMQDMIKRSRAAGVRSMIITGGSLSESRKAISLAKELDFYCTVGCHPTRSGEMDKFNGGAEKYLEGLDKLIESNVRSNKGKVVAVGECGLDYDRLHFASEETQMKHFRKSTQLTRKGMLTLLAGPQLTLAKKYRLPLFLHVRGRAFADFVRILREEGFGENGGRDVGASGGVVHSFTGSAEEMKELMDMGFHISFNGCSMKKEEQLQVIKTIQPDRLLLETDAPWCSMTSTHASKKHIDAVPETHKALFFPAATRPEAFVAGKPVKGRNEPTAIGGVAWVIACITGVPFEKVVEKAWKNTVALFGLEELERDNEISDGVGGAS